MNNTEQIESYLFGKMSPGEKLVFDTRLLIDGNLKQTCDAQKSVYEIVNLYGRRKLKAQVDLIHHELMTAPHFSTFKTLVQSIFS